MEQFLRNFVQRFNFNQKKFRVSLNSNYFPLFKLYLELFFLLKRFLIFQFFIPVIQISLFCLCIGREPYDLNFGIVNNETIYNSSEQFGSEMYTSQLNNRTFKKVILNGTWSGQTRVYCI